MPVAVPVSVCLWMSGLVTISNGSASECRDFLPAGLEVAPILVLVIDKVTENDTDSDTPGVKIS